MQPFYWHSEPNQDIGLYQGPLNFSTGDRSFSGVGSLQLRWLPTPWIVYEASVSVEALRSVAWDDLPDVAVSVDALGVIPSQSARSSTGQSGPPGNILSLDGRITSVPLDCHAPISSLVTLLVNFPETSRARNEVELRGAGWSVKLDQRSDFREIKRRVQQTGGYVITHVCEVRRADGSEFDLADGERLLQCLQSYFAFVAGAYVGPVLPVAFDSADAPIWSRWASPDVDSWSTRMTWFDSRSAEQLEELFPLFISRWQDAYWQVVLSRSMSYYRDANAPRPVQRAVAQAIMMLDMLTFSIMVEERGRLSRNRFRRLSAAIDDLLRELRIPGVIPAGRLPLLDGEATSRSWATGPEALVKLRDSYVHPSRVWLTVPFEVWAQAWRLAVWYCEMVLLAFLGYRGTHGSRLIERRWVGQVEPVPWS